MKFSHEAFLSAALIEFRALHKPRIRKSRGCIDVPTGVSSLQVDDLQQGRFHLTHLPSARRHGVVAYSEYDSDWAFERVVEKHREGEAE